MKDCIERKGFFDYLFKAELVNCFKKTGSIDLRQYLIIYFCNRFKPCDLGFLLDVISEKELMMMSPYTSKLLHNENSCRFFGDIFKVGVYSDDVIKNYSYFIRCLSDKEKALIVDFLTIDNDSNETKKIYKSLIAKNIIHKAIFV